MSDRAALILFLMLAVPYGVAVVALIAWVYAQLPLAITLS